MQTDNNYFTFLGTMYEGNWKQAFELYQQAKIYATFSEYLKHNHNPITSHQFTIEQTEREFLTARLKENNYNLSKTARQINITRVALCNHIIRLQIEIPGRKLNYIQYTKKIKL